MTSHKMASGRLRRGTVKATILGCGLPFWLTRRMYVRRVIASAMRRHMKNR